MIESNRNPVDWEEVWFEWLAWSLPLEMLEEAPDYVILRTWLGVKKVKQKEQNAISQASAILASIGFNYLKDKTAPTMDAKDFLPWKAESGFEKMVSIETAKLLIELRDDGKIPPNILSEITSISGLYETICELNGQSRDS